jgi:hypothetical protein
VPAVFFAVSDATFCNDDAAYAAMKDMSRAPERLSSAGRVRDEYHLFELAQEARVTISMSFHGCLLSAIAGAPFVPVTEGVYYNYKYAGFDKYTGGQGTPLVSLSGHDTAADFERVRDFVDRFDASLVCETREAASELTDKFYRNAIGGNQAY